MSDFECPYCGQENDNNSLSDYFDSQDETEIDCKSCKRTLVLYREFDPVYYPIKLENKIKDLARQYKSTLKYHPENTNWLSFLKKEIASIGEVIKAQKVKQ